MLSIDICDEIENKPLSREGRPDCYNIIGMTWQGDKIHSKNFDNYLDLCKEYMKYVDIIKELDGGWIYISLNGEMIQYDWI